MLFMHLRHDCTLGQVDLLVSRQAMRTSLSADVIKIAVYESPEFCALKDGLWNRNGCSEHTHTHHPHCFGRPSAVWAMHGPGRATLNVGDKLQVVALCNGLVGRVPCGGKQAVHAHLRPISLSTPAGRFDWDPVGEVGCKTPETCWFYNIWQEGAIA